MCSRTLTIDSLFRIRPIESTTISSIAFNSFSFQNSLCWSSGCSILLCLLWKLYLVIFWVSICFLQCKFFLFFFLFSSLFCSSLIIACSCILRPSKRKRKENKTKLGSHLDVPWDIVSFLWCSLNLCSHCVESKSTRREPVVCRVGLSTVLKNCLSFLSISKLWVEVRTTPPPMSNIKWLIVQCDPYSFFLRLCDFLPPLCC